VYSEKTFEEIEVGDTASISKTISEYDVYGFAGITGDLNPAHVNEEVAKKSRFGRRIAHGTLSLGLVSAVLGMQLPGPGSIFGSLSSNFKRPVYFGDTITAEVEVIEKIKENNRIRLSFNVRNQKNETAILGMTEIWKP